MHRLPQPSVHRLSHGTTLTALAALTLTLAACTSPTDTAGEAAPSDTGGHGYVEGASELPEPQLLLATADTSGTIRLLDLVDEQQSTVASLGPLSALSGDGRFVAAQSEPPGTVTIVDTGVWTVDHEDHQHYYRADARVVGTVQGEGAATIVSGSATIAVRFADSGETILLDTTALGTGEIDETGRIASAPGIVGVAVPIGETVATTSASGSLVLSGTDGEPLDATSTSVAAANAVLDGCTAAAGTITTNVGVVIGCAEGALLAVVDRSSSDADPVPSFEAIPYPQGIGEAERATSFDARPGRPTVAAVAGTTGAWLLDTRERSWSLLTTPTPLQLVAAVDDRDQHVVALATDGTVLVLDGATGAVTGATAPIATAADLRSGVQLEVDQNRAYLNSPTARTVSEIDYRDAGRIARTFAFDTEPAFLAETGR